MEPELSHSLWMMLEMEKIVTTLIGILQRSTVNVLAR